MSAPFWTPEREQQLASLWAEGNSAAAIAGIMGTASRSVILGRVRRLGLKRDPSKVPPKPPRAMPKNSPVRAAVSRRKVQVKLAGAVGAPVEAVEDVRSEPRSTQPPSGPVTLANLRRGACHFPMWSSAEKSGPYCGEPTGSPLRSWCSHHHGVVFSPVQPGRAR